MRTDREVILEIFERTEGLRLAFEEQNYVEFINEHMRESLSLEFNEDGSLRCIY